MKRLTKKDGLGRYYSDYCGPEKQPEIQKLGQLEDSEEELGTDFLILAKANKHGIYRKMANGIEFYPRYVLSVYIDHIMVNTSGKQLFLFEYGTTWALTKEELL